MTKEEILKVLTGLGIFALIMWLIVWLIKKG